MLEIVADVARDLAEEDPALAVETYFEPLRVKALASPNFADSDCSIDGYYESNVDERQPWILYSADASLGRVRFTILHELGHHVLSTSGAHLLDDLDAIGGSPSGAIQAEEMACHSFAGQLLVPRTLIDAEVGDSRVRPAHVLAVYEKCQASWEAVAVRVAEESAHKAVVLVVREPGKISFAATSRHFSPIRWPRGSMARVSGPIAVALSRNKQVAVKDSYRWRMPYEEQLYCDTERVNDGLAIAVMGDRRSDGRFGRVPRSGVNGR